MAAVRRCCLGKFVICDVYASDRLSRSAVHSRLHLKDLLLSWDLRACKLNCPLYDYDLDCLRNVPLADKVRNAAAQPIR